MNKYSEFVLGSCLLLFALPTLGSSLCLEKVFGRYCLGGDIVELQRARPEYLHEQREGPRFALVYGNQSEKDYVMAYRGKIYKVVRQYRPPTSAKYRHLRNELRNLYGMPREFSRFPLYARRLSTKIKSIELGEGQALLMWSADDWRVELSWTMRMGISLAYIADVTGGEGRHR